MPTPFDGFVNKVKSGTKAAASQVNLAARIAKLKVEMSTQKGEKERHLRTIGTKTYAIFCKSNNLDGNVVAAEISNELNLIQRIDKHLVELEEEIAQMQAEFRNSGDGRDIVDASEVTDTTDDASEHSEEH